MTQTQTAERQAAILDLRKLFPPGSTVYTKLEHVSRSGMTRYISVLCAQVDDDGRPYFLHPNHLISIATGIRRAPDRYDGLNMGGCGMDMGFALVYDLSYALYPDGFGCVGKGCPSNAHSNGDRDYTPHVFTPHNDGGLNHAHWHKDGGYALRHSWL